MKILIVGDIHWSNKGIQLHKGTRLKHCLDTVNWCEKLAKKKKVDRVIYLGDFFDRSDINAEELSTFQKIEWYNKVPHDILVGNHELSKGFNSCEIFKLVNFTIYDKPTSSNGIYYLPYLTNCISYKDLKIKDKLVVSHNDLAGIQMGKFKSTHGFNLDEIKNTLFINGHIHNGSYIKDNVLNLGITTGQNFSEDASKYAHNVAIAEDGIIELIENPYALNFYHLTDIKQLSTIKDNACVIVKCARDKVDNINKKLDKCEKIVYYKVLIDITKKEKIKENIKLEKIDHIKQFQEYIIDKLGDDELVKGELELCLK